MLDQLRYEVLMIECGLRLMGSDDRYMQNAGVELVAIHSTVFLSARFRRTLRPTSTSTSDEDIQVCKWFWKLNSEILTVGPLRSNSPDGREAWPLGHMAAQVIKCGKEMGVDSDAIEKLEKTLLECNHPPAPPDRLPRRVPVEQ